jgi:hypothetical protein
VQRRIIKFRQGRPANTPSLQGYVRLTFGLITEARSWSRRSDRSLTGSSMVWACWYSRQENSTTQNNPAWGAGFELASVKLSSCKDQHLWGSFPRDQNNRPALALRPISNTTPPLRSEQRGSAQGE